MIEHVADLLGLEEHRVRIIQAATGGGLAPSWISMFRALLDWLLICCKGPPDWSTLEKRPIFAHPNAIH